MSKQVSERAAFASCEHLLDLPGDVLGKVLLLCPISSRRVCCRFRSAWGVSRAAISIKWEMPVDEDLKRLLTQLPSLFKMVLECGEDFNAEGHQDVLRLCPRLRSLVVTFAGIPCLECLSVCTQLTQLQLFTASPDPDGGLDACFLGLDINPLTACVALEELHVQGTVLDLRPLSECRSLHTLFVSEDESCEMVYEDEHPVALGELSGCTSLTSLSLDCNMLSDIVALAALTGLQSLSIGGSRDRCDLNPLSALAACVRLTSLRLTRCGMVDLSFLQPCSPLVDLVLTRCHNLKDISALVAFSHLTSVDLGGCRALRDYVPLTACPRLTSLHVRDGQLDVAQAAQLTATAAISGRPSFQIVTHDAYEVTDDGHDDNDDDGGDSFLDDDEYMQEHGVYYGNAYGENLIGDDDDDDDNPYDDVW